MFLTTKKKLNFFLILIFFFSAFLRFYNLNWGAPFYFHPDERNIASSVTQLSFPSQMNPHFFAYGSLPIYTIYFVGLIENIAINSISRLPFLTKDMGIINITHVSFEQAIQISRFISGLISLFLIPLLFWIGKKIKDEKTGIVLALLASFSTGFIQFAHFGTFEMWLTLESILLFIFTLKLLKKPDFASVLITGIIFGVSVATKISHLTLIVLPLFSLLYSGILSAKKKKKVRSLLNTLRNLILFFAVSFLIYILTNPFVVLDFPDFLGSMKYESGVALGTMPVFYTGEFVSAIPVIFQFWHIYPFLVNPLITAIFLPSFIFLFVIALKRKKVSFLFVLLFYLFLFCSQAFLYAKWTRYMLPTLPFIYLSIAICFSYFWEKKPRKTSLVFSVVFMATCLFGISYMVTAYLMPDTREEAAAWAKLNIPKESEIISEVYDLGITPFNDSFSHIALFNFYDLDNNSPDSTQSILKDKLTSSEYLIIPSQRILKVRLNESKKFPAGSSFYSKLTSGSLNYIKIYETPCNLFCRIIYLNDPINSFEETANVFDRPTLFIYRKI